MTGARSIPDRLDTRAGRVLKSWEALLLALAVAIFIANCLSSPYFLSPWNLSDATFNFTEKAMIAFPMALLIIAGEIDLSVAAIIALAESREILVVQDARLARMIFDDVAIDADLPAPLVARVNSHMAT